MNAMKKATSQGYKAFSEEEIPIGAAIVKDGKIIASAHNKREKSQIATHHAEILAIEKACKKLKSWRLDECDIYVTLEPCPMCAGAILNARIKNLFYAVPDQDNGGHSRFNMFSNTLNHTTNCFQLEEFEKENKQLIQNFFKNKRKIAKNVKKLRNN
ncbi:MAG: nucleoside deaminase [Clostridia bacterium]|nr:nucleoside deaminase [Clostridia bacterium]